MINEGVITMLNRGPKVSTIVAELDLARDRSIIAFQDMTVRVKTMKDCMPVDDYIAKYKVDPKANGEQVELVFHLKKWQECVVWNVQEGNMSYLFLCNRHSKSSSKHRRHITKTKTRQNMAKRSGGANTAQSGATPSADIKQYSKLINMKDIKHNAGKIKINQKSTKYKSQNRKLLSN